jgi:Spy/CpxP family protein refolding chaperone
MLTRLSLILVVPALLWSQLCAQPPRGPRPWWDSEISRDLNLSDAQTKQIRQTQKEFRSRMFELRSEVNKTEADVEAAFNEDPVDQNKANDAINRLATARAELTKAVSQMDLKLRMILTAQQWQELKEKQRRLWPGGPGGPGPGRHSPRGTSTPSNTSNQQK